MEETFFFFQVLFSLMKFAKQDRNFRSVVVSILSLFLNHVFEEFCIISLKLTKSPNSDMHTSIKKYFFRFQS